MPLLCVIPDQASWSRERKRRMARGREQTCAAGPVGPWHAAARGAGVSVKIAVIADRGAWRVRRHAKAKRQSPRGPFCDKKEPA